MEKQCSWIKNHGKRNITETNRLSFVIRAIDKDLTVLPVGGFIITQINKLRRNDLFEGFN